MFRHCIVSFFLVVASAPAIAGQGVPATIRPDSSSSAGREHFRLDLDGDGKGDEMILWPTPHPDGTGLYDRLELRLTRAGHHTLRGDWDDARESDHPQKGNLVSSKVVYVGRFPRAGTLIFLGGEDVGCCAQGLSIYRVTASGVSKYFESEEFIYTKPLEPSTRGVVSLVGVRSLSEFVGTTAPKAANARTYNPTVVIRLEERARLDTAASAAATRATVGGFAGVAFSEHILMVTAVDSSRFLWDERAHRRIP